MGVTGVRIAFWLACALHLCAWIDLPATTRYYAYDLHAPRIT
jgi:hypothetical protein